MRYDSSFYKTLVLVLIITFCSPLAADAQQYSAWSAAENLGPGINTTFLDGCPFISKDNRALFFATNRDYGLNQPTDLWVSLRESHDAVWGEPFSLGADINTAGAEEFCPTLTISSRYLYFVSNRPGGCGGNDIYVARRLDKDSFTHWGEPQNLGCQVNSAAADITPSLFEDEDGSVYLYFSSNRPGGVGLQDIYVSILGPDGIFGPASLVPGLNTVFNDLRPNIRVRDGLEIFFESNRTGTLGNTDLYVSTRESTASHWTTPENLGALVNSAFVEGRASLSFDGTELYFMSNRPGVFGDQQDVYVTRRTRLTRP